MAILEEETYEKFGYYPSDLGQYSLKPILTACDNCGKIREASKHDYYAICRQCAAEIKGTARRGKPLSKEWHQAICDNVLCGKNSPNWKGGEIEVSCENCGIVIKVSRGRTKKQKRFFCSQKCYGEWISKNIKGENSPNWKGGKVKCICLVCGKKFERDQNEIKIGRAKYCSYLCARKARKIPNKYTKPERIFQEICQRNNLDFHYVGDGSLWIGKKGEKQLNPDFIEANGKKICIEIMGDYWHSPLLLNKNLREDALLSFRQKHFQRFGWKTIFLWEMDLKRKDAEQFVLNTLKKNEI